MSFNFWNFLIGKKPDNSADFELKMSDFCQRLQELQLRTLAFQICVNMIANAIGRCEVRTYKNGKEVKEAEYWRWNVEPNNNQNSTAFWHKLVEQLYKHNEALIVEVGTRSTRPGLCVADTFSLESRRAVEHNKYSGVTVGDTQYSKTFDEKDVLHIVLNNSDIKVVLDGIAEAYAKAHRAALDAFNWGNGKHMKVSVGQIPSGEEDFEQKFMKMLNDQVKPFFGDGNTILPEFDGYTYSDLSLGSSLAAKSSDVNAMAEEVFNLTAQAFLIPVVLSNGKVEQTKDAHTRFLTDVIDPLCDQLAEEGNRKIYGYDEWADGTYMMVDSSAIIHFDIFGNAANIEKLVGSGAYSVNDVLRAAGHATISEPWADQHYMTKNIGTVQEVLSMGEQKGE